MFKAHREFLETVAQTFRGTEVRGRARDISFLPHRHVGCIRHQITVAVQLHDMVPHLVLKSTQVEIGVIGERHRRRLVGRGMIRDPQLVRIVEPVFHRHPERAGVAFFAIRTGEGKRQDRITIDHFAAGIPYPFIEALDAAMDVVGAVIGGDLVVPVRRGEFAILDATGVAPDQTAKVG